MTIYLSSYVLICLNSIISLKFRDKESLFWFFSIFILIFINTAKWNVGGDWWVYYDYIIILKSRGLIESLSISEPGFILVAWINARLGFDLPGLNLFASLVFFIGFNQLIKNENGKWLSLLIMIPLIYFITFQGYLRQGIALGFILLSISNLIDKKNFNFFIYIFLAFLFHRSALFCLIFYFHDFYKINRAFLKILLLSSAIIFIFFLFKFIPIINIEINKVFIRLINDFRSYYTFEYRISVGAIPRGVLSILPALIFVLFYKRFKNYKDFSILLILSFISFMLFGLSFFYSTIADRLSIYVLSLQIIIYPRFVEFIDNNFIKFIVILIIILSYFFIFIFYLNFADNGNQYFPYDIYFFRDNPLTCQLLPYEACR